jgi:hypothetical protein
MTERLKRGIGEYIGRRKEVSVKITTKFEGQGAIVSDGKKIYGMKTARREMTAMGAPRRKMTEGALAMNHRMKIGGNDQEGGTDL